MPQVSPVSFAQVLEQQHSTQPTHVPPVTVEQTAKGIGAQGSNSPATASSTSEASPTPVEPPKPTISQSERQDRERMQALARREQNLRAQARAFQKSQEDFKRSQEQFKADQEIANQGKQWKEKIGNPDQVMQVLSEAGYTTDQISQMLLNQPGPEQQYIIKMQSEIQELRKIIEDSNSKYAQDQASQYQSAVKQLQVNVDKIVATNPEFETVKAYGAQKNVTKYIEEVYKEEGVLLDPSEAAKDVEDLLLEQALSVAKLSKVQSKLNPPRPQQAAPKEAAAAQPKAQPTPTLTNKIGSGGKPLSSKERAILAFKGQLK